MAIEKKPDPPEKPAADPARGASDKTTSLGPEAFMTEQEKEAMKGDKKPSEKKETK